MTHNVYNILFVGAHPDDIEIGAGGTVARLVSMGHNVAMCVLSDQSDKGVTKVRQNEAYAAAKQLGVPEDRVFFCGLEDTNIKANGESIGNFREILRRAKFKPHVVFTHTSADDHNDHKAARELTCAAVREACVLHYGIPNSAVGDSSDQVPFEPTVYVDTTGFRERKEKALAQHKSQITDNRILWEKIFNNERACGAQISTQSAEGFSMTAQAGCHVGLAFIQNINDCPFNNFWYQLIGSERIYNIHAVPVHRQNKEYAWQENMDRKGLAYLQKQFTKYWSKKMPIDEIRSDDSTESNFCMQRSHVLLSGGSVANEVARRCFNHFVGVRYVIDYEMPDYKNISIKDLDKNIHLRAEYIEIESDWGNIIPKIDMGILTIMNNPMAPGKKLIGCMGIHGFGSMACFQSIGSRKTLAEILQHMDLALIGMEVEGYQVLLKYDVRLGALQIDWDTLHKITK